MLSHHRPARRGPGRFAVHLAAALTLPALLALGACGDDDSAPAPDAAVDATPPPGDARPDSQAPDATPTGCGNGLLEAGEACDGPALGTQTCAGLGLPAGQLACAADCTLDTTGCAVCDDGVCSDGETAVTCPADCGVVDVAAGATHTCAVLADGTVWCWGAREGHHMGGTGDVSTPVMVPGIDTAVEVVAGRHHTCVRTVLDEILCWGANGYGQVGTDPPSHEVFPPVQVATGRFPRAGAYHTCVRATATEVRCWGRVYLDRTTAASPVTFPGGGLLVAGEHHTCFIENSTLQCLGRNDRGQLGQGDRAWREAPTEVDVSWSFMALGTGASHTCVSYLGTNAQGLHCWGSNEYGQLGIPPGPDVSSPLKVSPLIPQIIDGGLRHTCAKASPLPDTLYCWGHNSRGQLGTGEVVSGYDFQQVAIPEVSTFDIGDEHGCAILPDQTLRCWGDNRAGQIGNGAAEAAVPFPAAPHRLGPPEEEVTP